MVQITEDNRPGCEYCNNKAISYLNNTWVCGNCVKKLVNKIKSQQDRLILEE